MTAADGGVTSYTRDLDGNVLTTTDPMLNVTTQRLELAERVDAADACPRRPQATQSPVLAWTYDANGNELTYTDAPGPSHVGNLGQAQPHGDRNAACAGPRPIRAGDDLRLRQPLAQDFGDDGAGHDHLGLRQHRRQPIDQQTLPPPSGSGSGPTTSYFYDADGRQNQVENALGQYTTTAFTADGQTASVTDNLNHTVSYVYGHGGELLSALPMPIQHTTSDEYDSRYRLVQTTDANGGVTQITLDGVGNTTALVDSVNNQTTWTFSPVNLPLTETNALGTTTTTYNLDREPTSIEDADGRERDFVYNNDQQLTAENWMSGSTIVATMNYGYDLAGELTSRQRSQLGLRLRLQWRRASRRPSTTPARPTCRTSC